MQNYKIINLFFLIFALEQYYLIAEKTLESSSTQPKISKKIEFKPYQSSVYAVIPFSENKIEIDGKIKEEEWKEANAFTGFIDNTHREYAKSQTTIYASFNATQILLGFQMQKGALDGTEVLTIALKPSERVFIWEIRLKESRVLNKDQQKVEGVQMAQSIEGSDWHVELAIPYTLLETTQPIEQSKWQANFARTLSNPVIQTSWVSRMAKERVVFAENELGRIEFSKSTPFLKMLSFGGIDQGLMRVKGSITGRNKESTEGLSKDQEIKTNSLKEEGQESKQDLDKKDIYIGFPCIQKGNETGYGQTVYFHSGKKEEFSLVSHGGEDESIQSIDRPYESLYINALYGRRDDHGNVIMSEELFRSERYPAGKPFPKMEIATWHQYGRKEMVVWIETYGLTALEIGKKTIELTLVDAEGKALQVATITKALYGEYEVEFDSLDLKFGKNKLVAILKSEDGKELVRSEKIVEKFNPSHWQNKKLGVTDIPPAPFEPVKVNGNQVEVWGRQYLLSEDSLIREIRSAGKSILSQPIRLRCGYDGAPLNFTTSGWKFEKITKNEAVAINRLSTEDLELNLQLTFEYDGMIRVDVTFNPKKEIVLDSMVVDIPIKAEQSKYLNWTRGLSASSTVPQHDPRFSELHKNWGYGSFPEKGFTGSFRPFVWLGDEDRGLLWFAESMKGWNIQDPEKVIQIQKGTGLQVTMIDGPTVFSEASTFTFGLQASPVRPRPQDWRKFSQSTVFGMGHSDAANIHGDVEYDLKSFKEGNDRRRLTGKKMLIYAYPLNMGCSVPNYEFVADRMRSNGSRSRAKASSVCDPMCATTDWKDYYLWMLNKAIDYDSKHGLLYDLCWAQPSDRLAYTDRKGEKQLGYGIFAQRELLKRIYTLYKTRTENMPIVAHVSSNSCILPFFSFMDATWNGEQHAYWVRNYIDEVPAHEWRAEFTGRQLGAIPLFLSELRYVQPEEKMTESLLTMIYLHDTLLFNGLHNSAVELPFQKMREEFGVGENDVEFIPYWEGMGKLFKTEDQNLLISGYFRSNSALLTVGNLSAKSFMGEITIDLKSLKLNPNTIEFFDGKNRQMVIPQGDRIKIKVNPKSLAFIYLH